MHISAIFAQKDHAAIIAFMRQYSFATIVSTYNNRSNANHIPLLIGESAGALVLSGHFSRSNRQWEELPEHPVLAIFQEPHAYISPRHYDKVENVPTWNYIAVHAYGKARLIQDEVPLRHLMEQTILQYEPAYLDQWKNLPEAYQSNMLKGIVGFQIEVTELQAKNKLSQNKTENEQKRIVNALTESELDNERAVGEAMKKNLLQR
jgi:transcriptional regulator